MEPLLRSAEHVPNWIRAAAAVALPVLAFVTAATRTPLTVGAFVALTGVVLYLHAPVFVFDGPLPFSDLGLHASGGVVHPWSHVTAVQPLGDRDLEAVLADGETVRLRVRGRRTREDLRAALARHRPELARF